MDYCVPAQGVRDVDSEALDVRAPIAASPRLEQRFSRQDLLLAHAVGALEDLDILSTPDSGLDEDAWNELLLRIESRLLLFSTTLSSVSAELNCETKRTGRMATLLQSQESRRQNLLTVSSIVVGALTTTVTAISSNDRANDIIDISGSAVSAGLGLAALFWTPSLRFTHTRNLLADVWWRPEHSQTFPPSLWFVLRNKDFSNEQHHSILHNVRARWVDSGYVEDPAGAAPYFGAGGSYTLDELQTRAQMLGELEAAVRLIHQDLQSLLTRVVSATKHTYRRE